VQYGKLQHLSATLLINSIFGFSINDSNSIISEMNHRSIWPFRLSVWDILAYSILYDLAAKD
jgi:hypothetical protein